MLYYVTVTGDLPGVSGPLAADALITFTPSKWLPAPADGELIPPSPVTARLLTGTFSASLLATSNTDTPAGWTWAAEITGIPDVAAYSFTFSLTANQVAFTATNASPCVFTATGSAYSNGQAVTLAGSSLPAPFTAGTTYYVTGVSGSSFSLAATSGGSAIASTTTGSGWVIPVQDISSLA